MEEKSQLIVVRNAIFHGITGGILSCGGITLASSLLKRQLLYPNNLALSIGIFTSVFRVVEYYDRKVYAIENSKRAALISAPLGLLYYHPRQRHSLIAYAITQAVVSYYEELKELRIVSPPRISLELPLLSITTARIVYLWFVSPKSFQQSHLRSMEYHSAVPLAMMTRVRDDFANNTVVSTCQSLHPSVSCHLFLFRALFKLFQRTSVVLLKVHMVSSFIMKWKKWKDAPSFGLLFRSLVKYLRSVLFLSTYFFLALSMSCVLSKTCIRPYNRLILYLCGLLSSVAIFIETAPRRKSIVILSWTYTLITIGRDFSHKFSLSQRGKLVKCLLEVITFSVSVSQLLKKSTDKHGMLKKLLYGY